jgi:putative membrane protein
MPEDLGFGWWSDATAEPLLLRSRVKVALPLTLTQNEMISQLRAERGPARDAAYIAQQRAAHGQALAVQQAYATDGTAVASKVATAKIVPLAEAHVAMLKTM